MAYRRTKRPLPPVPLTGYCKDCGKVRYMSRSDARQEATKMSRRMRAYRCPGNGSFWHLTSWGPQSRVAYYREHETGEG